MFEEIKQLFFDFTKATTPRGRPFQQIAQLVDEEAEPKRAPVVSANQRDAELETLCKDQLLKLGMASMTSKVEVRWNTRRQGSKRRQIPQPVAAPRPCRHRPRDAWRSRRHLGRDRSGSCGRRLPPPSPCASTRCHAAHGPRNFRHSTDRCWAGSRPSSSFSSVASRPGGIICTCLQKAGRSFLPPRSDRSRSGRRPVLPRPAPQDLLSQPARCAATPDATVRQVPPAAPRGCRTGSGRRRRG